MRCTRAWPTSWTTSWADAKCAPAQAGARSPGPACPFPNTPPHDRRHLSRAAHAVLTPYLIPPSLQQQRVINVGDGFILRAVERRLGAFAPALAFTSREAPQADQLRRLDDCAAIIVAGANQLTDHYSVWPG